jgi:hypothetical protein
MREGKFRREFPFLHDNSGSVVSFIKACCLSGFFYHAIRQFIVILVLSKRENRVNVSVL